VKSISYLHFMSLLTVTAFTSTASAASNPHIQSSTLQAGTTELYNQQIEITFKTAQAAQNASVEILPLYNGYTWAISSRWDDNSYANLKMRDLLNSYGHKATFYLNSPNIEEHHSYLRSGSNTEKKSYVLTAKDLLKGGNSIGGHSLSHPLLTYANRNRIFEELADIRAKWEAAVDTPVLSYAFSFGDYWNLAEKQNVQADIDQALKRAGFYHIAERAPGDFYFLSRTPYSDMPTDTIFSWIMPSDGKDIEPFMEKALSDESLRKKSPNFSFSMHAWAYDTEKEWADFKTWLKKYGNNPRFWYCNQNQYAAYRYQFLNSKIAQMRRTGNKIKLTLQRPTLLTVNDPTPLTLAVRGIESDDIISFNCPAARTSRKTNSNIFNLYHTSNQKLPEKIALVTNKENRNNVLKEDPDFPGLKTLLYFDNGALSLLIENQTNKPMENIRINFRLPLAFKEGIVRKKIKDIPAGKIILEKLTPTLFKKDYKYNAGSYFLATQIDFTLAGKTGRIHATCKVKNNIEDKSYPQGGFLKLGPIAPDKLNVETFVEDVKTGKFDGENWQKSWKLDDGTVLQWNLDPKDSPHTRPYLNVEVIRTSGWWKERPHRQTYILQTSIYSPKKQPVKFLYLKKSAKLLLNGKEVTGKEYLNKGDNHLIVISSSQYEKVEFPDQQTRYKNDYKSECVGCFLRLENPNTGGRLTNIRFEPQKVKLHSDGFYRIAKKKDVSSSRNFPLLDDNRKPYIPFEFPIPKYTQQLEIKFKNPSAAQKAVVEVLPLYNGCDWAVSSRWDDNNIQDLKMRDTLAKHGHKGNFYLTSTNKYDHWLATGNIGFETETFTETARKLLKGGNAIGCHSMSHPFLTYVNRNRIFEELAAIRGQWEAEADTLINSYAFSYCNFRNEVEGDVVHADITRALERAGYYNIANGWYNNKLNTDMILSPIMPEDGKDIDDFARAALANEEFKKKHPNLSYSMHVWYKTPQAWSKFESQLDDYGHNPNWWYCNQNQYAAYRYQFLHSNLSEPRRTGNTIKLTITRPTLLQLNNPTPLTLAVKNIHPEDILSINCPTARCELSDKNTNDFIFHLYHNRDQKLPDKIGLITNDQNQKQPLKDDPDFPGLKALLSFDNNDLNLELHNITSRPLENIQVAFRLPLACGQGLLQHKIKTIPPDEGIIITVSSSLVKTDYKYNAGIYFFAAQIDFVTAGKAGRIHTTCKVPNEIADDSYPQGRFLKLGPIPTEQFDIQNFLSNFHRKNYWNLADGTVLFWQLDPNDSPLKRQYLDPEVIRTIGTWRCKKRLVYILQSFVYCEESQPAKFIYNGKDKKRIFLNDKEVTSAVAQLNRGNNHILIIDNGYGFGNHSAEHAGTFLRLVNPNTNKRLKNIKFVPKKLLK